MFDCFGFALPRFSNNPPFQAFQKNKSLALWNRRKNWWTIWLVGEKIQGKSGAKGKIETKIFGEVGL